MVFNNLGKKIKMVQMKQHCAGAGTVLGSPSNVRSASWRYSIELLKKFKIVKLGKIRQGERK